MFPDTKSPLRLLASLAAICAIWWACACQCAQMPPAKQADKQVTLAQWEALQGYLEETVASDDFEDNLAAMGRLAGGQLRPDCLKSELQREHGRAARTFVRLAKAMQWGDCSDTSIEYLDALQRVRKSRRGTGTEGQDKEAHLGRLDRMLDRLIEGFRRLCTDRFRVRAGFI